MVEEILVIFEKLALDERQKSHNSRVFNCSRNHFLMIDAVASQAPWLNASEKFGEFAQSLQIFPIHHFSLGAAEAAIFFGIIFFVGHFKKF